MEKIEFFKNNRLVNLNNDKIIFDEQNLVINKENDETLVTMDFINKTCQLSLKETNKFIDIPVLKMHHNHINNKHLFEYTLVSEPEIENLLIITKN